MSRRRRSILRKINPDPKYGSIELSKFINRLMRGGKKSVARKAVYLAIDKLENQIKRPGLELFEEAMKNTMPTLEVKPRRVGGATYQVPVEIRPKRRVALAHRWIVEAARSRKGETITNALYSELSSAVNNTGIAIKKKEDSHRMAEANRAFAHYRW
jgi:small subunit ribosomal protein S7